LKNILKKHKKILSDYENQKSKILKKLANKLIDIQSKNEKLKNKEIDKKFLDLL